MQEKPSTLKKEKKHLSLRKQRRLSSTEIAFKSKKIKVLFQKGIQERLDDIHLNYALNLNEKLSSIFQQNDNIRRISADSLLEIAKNYPKIIYENIDRVLNITSSCWIDSDLHVRKTIYAMTLELLKSKSNGFITPFSNIIFMQIKSTLSHIRNEVRMDGLNFLNEYLLIEFGRNKEKFITLRYLLGWSPLVCRIAQSANLHNALDSLFIITVTIREIINQILFQLKKLNDYEFDGMSNFELKSSISLLYDSLIHISFEIISKREQKFNDQISLCGMNLFQNQKKFKHDNSSSMIIKRSLIPNIPTFVLNDWEYILSFLSSIILDTMYNINKYGGSFINKNKQLNKICNSIKKIQLQLKNDSIFSHSDGSNVSIFHIEKLLLLRIYLLPTFMERENCKNDINKIIQDYFSILRYFKAHSNNENEPLFDINHSELFEFIFLEGVEMMYVSSFNRNILRKLFTPNKYVLFYSLSMILDIKDSLNQLNVHELDLNKTKYNEFFDQEFSYIFSELNNKNTLSVKEVFHILLIHTVNSITNIASEDGKLTITVLKIILFLPVILSNAGYTQKYYFDQDFSIWSPIEHILVSIIERLNFKSITNPLKNDIMLAKYWISNIPKLIFFLYYCTVEQGKECPTSLICNLLLVLEDYIMNRMPIQLEDSSLSMNICKSIMPFFINTKQTDIQKSIITTLPFNNQKSIISTLPFWPYLPKKFLLSIIDQVLSFMKNGTNLLYSFFIIKTLITQPNNSSLSLEDKISIFVAIINGCDCKPSTKFQLFNLLSEYLIDLSKTYIILPKDKEDKYFYKIFLKIWFIPLINYLNQFTNSEIKLSNISLFFNCTVSKTIEMQLITVPVNINCTSNIVDNFSKCIKDQICNYIAFIPKFEMNYFYLEQNNINLIYDTIISNIKKSDLTVSNIEQIIPLSTLKYPILIILYIWKAYVYFNYQESSVELQKNKSFLLYSVVKHIFEKYIFDEERNLKDYSLERLFTFSVVSILWIISMKDYYLCKHIGIDQIVEKTECFFKKNDNSYIFVCKAIRSCVLIN
ncbi:Testis-expressed sequence 10 [Cryptosporidium sp. chipmunk genotype I]|uniref:Testis-expressed sequence 10 n=1 Tax=Cryptosporidium sp. chipmunk genotype I TaxID=1280935 RepID=UPI00351A3F35|nr:Testis-expressed sequence 10 [Cryptosporidium sp. chipmunk genotype I]